MSEVRAPTITTAGMKRAEDIRPAFIKTVCERLAAGQRVRRTLPTWGRIHIDRQLPFLTVYRRPPDVEDNGADLFVIGEASYLMASGDSMHRKGLSKLVRDVARTLKDAFGSVLILEIWAARESKDGDDVFRIVVPKSHTISSTISALEQALVEEVKDDEDDVGVVETTKFSPPGLPALISAASAARDGIHLVGLEVRPNFRDPDSGELYPMVHREMQRRLTRATKQAFYDFTRRHTTHRPPHFLALGPRAMVKAVWTADDQLAAISNTYDLILSVTPVNAEEAWQKFRRKKFQRGPEFRYRPLPMDPSLLKRRLYKIPLEKIEDPTLGNLFYAQQLEQDRKISLLADRGSPNFILGSQQLYGKIDDELVNTALELLQRVSPRAKRKDTGTVDAQMFATYATEELDYLRRTFPDIKSRVIIRKDVLGIMVSRGNLLVSSSTSIAPARVPASLAHEVGTHLVTYINARMQPFKQLSIGLPGYEEFQEGIACLAEYLAGGLNHARIRLLAARVVAARRMVDGASLIEVFRELNREHNFTQRAAFNVAMRVFRGGGFTKDAVYLRGLMRVLEYLGDGGHLEPLLVGKFNLEHVPIIEELRLRRVLGPPPLSPSYLDDPRARERLDAVRSGMTIHELAKRLPR